MRRIPIITLALAAACGDDGPAPADGGGDVITDSSAIADQRVEARRDALPDSAPPAPGCPAVRSEADRPDDTDLYQVRAFYVLPSDGKDESLDTNGRICTSVRAFTHWLGQQTAGRTLRLDTAGGMLDIGFLRLSKTNAEMEGSNWAQSTATGYPYVRERIEHELVALGLTKAKKLYAVYYGGTSIYACGGAAYPPTLLGNVSAIYIKGQPRGYSPCESDPWGVSPVVPHYLDYSMLHDTLHVLGIVDAKAPHHHSTGHVHGDERDLMYQPRPGTSDPPWGTYDPAGLILDIGRDDYFEHGQPGVIDLARSVFLSPLPDGATKPPGW